MTQIKVTSANENEQEANDAKVYVGEEWVATMPDNVVKGKVYTFDCNAVGDFIKIETGRNDSDKMLTFNSVEVFTT